MDAMRTLLLAATLLILTPLPAFADLTAFLGRASAPENRSASGFAIGTGLLIVGFEFEYGTVQERLRTDDIDVIEDAPALKTYMFNGLLQTPVPIARTQFYGTIGGGVYNEKLSIDPGNDGTNFGTNIGGGAKITLVGPLRLRLDYRVFNLRGTPRHSTLQRFYAGVNLKF